MTTPEELTGWTLQVRLYRLRPILVATAPDTVKEFWVPFPILDTKVEIHKWLAFWEETTTQACEQLVEMIKADLEKKSDG